MEREGCLMSGGGEVSEPSSQGGMITLEDLDNMPEDQGSDSAYNSNSSLGNDTEQMEEQEQNRLLTYWQTVARGHQVQVPDDMAQPILQMTRNNQPQFREHVPFTLLSCKEKCGELLYEKRQYQAAKWACIKISEGQYEQSICLGFMKLMRYICEQNSLGAYLGMTVPIVTVVRTNELRTGLSLTVTVAYYLPEQFQEQPPEPYDTEIVIEDWPATVAYTRSFSGATDEETIMREINLFTELLDSPELHLNDTYIIAGYTNPAAPSRHNEIWFLYRP
ncbi:heme-binding protein 1-like [Protopterus annectens]|uniref:heme-binding protein 1-like n=1 Tax=Protopterus annectens TaxID=7888 RepID=UPI001CFC1F59|nr:heme-binding protein 1-like [Protopterus annectens]